MRMMASQILKSVDFLTKARKSRYLENEILLGWKIQSCPFLLKIGTHGLLEVLILNLHLDFWNSNPKIDFWAKFGRKTQSCLFCQKISARGISRMLILIPKLVFWISNPKSIFGQIWAKKVKNVRFAWKLACMVPRRYWFLFWN